MTFSEFLIQSNILEIDIQFVSACKKKQKKNRCV